ncbi:MAG TPA: lysophospholipid acyltransferase family protein, partial [Pyrinomonadaceae bacterium]|nr:lysophospholipid acyltransferase family protein [Pyrinomonadaceae bacterium]
EDSYRVEFDEAAFTEATTLQDVEKLVREGKPDEPSQYQYPRWQERWPNSWLRVVLFYLVVWPFTRVMARATIRGRNRLANISGPLVFVCNHVTLADHALVLLALPRKFRRRLAIAMDGELLKQWRYPSRDIKLFTRLVQRVEYLLVVLFFNVFSMPQKSGFRRSFAFAGELMDRGYNILIFPEGERTKHGEMNPFRPGTGLLISQLNAAVVPLRLDGLWELKQAGRHFAKPGEVLVTIGEPISYARGTEAEVISRDLQTKVKDL